MNPINLRVTGYSTGVATKDPFISVTDDYYCIDSAHDFKADRNTLDNLATYHEVIEKFNRRFNRFLEKDLDCKARAVCQNERHDAGSQRA
ncbi:DUF1796 family putative cysteine peptidase [Bacillus licheniformis]